MSETQLKNAIAKFLVHVNHTAQREIEKAIRGAVASGSLTHIEDLSAAITVASERVGLNITIHSKIAL